jgi:hypothetical protein
LVTSQAIAPWKATKGNCYSSNKTAFEIWYEYSQEQKVVFLEEAKLNIGLAILKWYELIQKDKDAIEDFLVQKGIVKKSGFSSPSIPTCDHAQQKVKIGKFTILASEAFSKAKRTIIPDLGVYLADVWGSQAGPVKAAGVRVPTRFLRYPHVMLDWDDGKSFDLQIIDWAVLLIIEQLKLGKQVEIGCIGGHGRTGTLMACILGYVENLLAAEAIAEVRKRYCPKAVESLAQITMVGQYLGGSVKDVKPTTISYTPSTQVYVDGKWQPIIGQGTEGAAYGWDGY